MTPLITITNLSKSYQDGEKSLSVFSNLSYGIEKGKRVAIVGRSGSGKSTLLNLLAALDTPDSGSVKIEGTEVTTLQGAAASEFRGSKLGFVFQFHHLLPEFTALENVAMPLRFAMKQIFSASEIEEQARKALELVGLSNRTLHRPNALSGGERARVALARAVVHKPLVLLADEPTGSLDAENAKKIEDLLFDLQDKYGTTLVLVTHNQKLAEKCNAVLNLGA